MSANSSALAGRFLDAMIADCPVFVSVRWHPIRRVDGFHRLLIQKISHSRSTTWWRRKESHLRHSFDCRRDPLLISLPRLQGPIGPTVSPGRPPIRLLGVVSRRRMMRCRLSNPLHPVGCSILGHASPGSGRGDIVLGGAGCGGRGSSMSISGLGRWGLPCAFRPAKLGRPGRFVGGGGSPYQAPYCLLLPLHQAGGTIV